MELEKFIVSILSLTGGVSVIVIVAFYFIRMYFEKYTTQFFDEKKAIFQSRLNEDLERHKYELNKSLEEFKIKYLKLYGKQSEIIEKLYSHISNIKIFFDDIMIIKEGFSNSPEKRELTRKVLEENKMLSILLENNRIYFSNAINESLKDIIMFNNESFNQIVTYDDTAIDSKLVQIIEKIEIAKKTLERHYQKQLGVI